MSFLDKAKDAAKKAVDEHGDKVSAATDRAGALIDQKTGHKHTDKIETGKRKVEEALDNLDRKNDDIPDRDGPDGRGRPRS
jgi:hypothetical protein